MGLSRKEYWSGLPFPSPGDLPNRGIEGHLLHLLHWQAGSLSPAPPGPPLTRSYQPGKWDYSTYVFCLKEIF